MKSREEASSPESGSSTAAHDFNNSKLPRRQLVSAAPWGKGSMSEEGRGASRLSFDSCGKHPLRNRATAEAVCDAKTVQVVDGMLGNGQEEVPQESDAYKFMCPASFIPRGPTTPEVEDVICGPVGQPGTVREGQASPTEKVLSDTKSAPQENKLVARLRDAAIRSLKSSLNDSKEDKVTTTIAQGCRGSQIPRKLKIRWPPVDDEGEVSCGEPETKVDKGPAPQGQGSTVDCGDTQEKFLPKSSKTIEGLKSGKGKSMDVTPSGKQGAGLVQGGLTRQGSMIPKAEGVMGAKAEKQMGDKEDEPQVEAKQWKPAVANEQERYANSRFDNRRW